MAACHACIRAEVERYGGLIAKSTPDGMLVCFGYPQAHEDHAERAVRAALAASTALAELRSRHLTSPLSPRGAIAAGPVVIGDMVGANATAEPAIVGEAPHLAGRLLALAGPGEVVISVGTHGLTGALFDYAEIGPVELRGLAEPIRAFRVLREGAITSRFDALHSAGTRLIGRGEELDLLLRRWRQARTGNGRVVLITGEPGIGKSRLIRALEEELTSEPHDPLCYHCAPHHEDSALYPIRRQLFRAAGIEQDDGSEVRLDKLEALLAHSTEGQAGTVPLFAALLSIAGGERYPPPGLTPQRLKERTLAALLDQLSRRAERRPVLVVFEDLHWIDPTTLELLSMMIDRAPELPMLLVASFRPEFKPPWPSHGYVSTISLGRLNRSEGQALIEEVAKDQALAPGLAEQIIARTDGIPLFIEELTKALLESSLSRDAGDLSEPAEPSPKLTIPSTLQVSLLARLDRLAGVKEVAQIAAVIGREFAYGLVTAVSALPDNEVQAALARLTEAELIFPRGVPPDARYLFKHALVQDAIYGTLLWGRRQDLHGRIACALEERRPDIVATVPEVLAHHFTAAGLPGEAIAYWLKAGQLARARSANSEAVAHLEKGLELVRSLPEGHERTRQELDLQVALGAALLMSRGHGAPEVAAVYHRSYELCQQLGDTSRLFPVVFGLYRHATMRPPLSRAQELAEQLLRLAEGSDEPTCQMMAHYAFGYSMLCLGELPAARHHLETSLKYYAPEQHRSALYGHGQDPGAACRAQRAWVLWLMGYPDQAAAANREALALARELAHPFSLAHGLWIAGCAAQFFGEAELAQEYAEEGIELAGKHGFALWRAVLTALRGWALAPRGQGAAGRAELRRGPDAERATVAERRQFFLTMLAEACVAADRCEEGLRAVADAQLHANRAGERWWQAEIHRVRGVLLLMRPGTEHAEAESCFRQSLHVARRQAARSLELRAATSLAGLWQRQGKADAARALLAPVYGWFTEGFDTADLKRAKALLDQLVPIG